MATINSSARIVFAVFQQSGSRTHIIGQFQNRILTFRVCKEFGFRVPDLEFDDLFHAKHLMHHTGTVPKQHIAARFLDQVRSKVLIGCKDDWLILGYALHDIGCIAAGADDVAQRFYACRAVDVGNNDVVGVFLLKLLKQLGRCRIGK